MAKEEVRLNDRVSVEKVKTDVYYLRVLDGENPNRAFRFTLRGRVKEMSAEAVLSLIENQGTKKGIFVKQGPIVLAPGVEVETTCRMSPENAAKLVGYLLGLKEEPE
jgi:hypothetical protein